MLDELLDVPVLVLLGILDRLANLRVGEALPDHRSARPRQTPVWCAGRKVCTNKIVVLMTGTAVCVGRMRGDRFSLCKVLTGAFAGYFSAIELAMGRTSFGNLLRGGKLARLQRVANRSSAPYSQIWSHAAVYLGSFRWSIQRLP